MSRISAITLAILLQNRWQVLLLAAWPWLFTLLMLHAGESASTEDVLSLLHQECMYGLALVAVLTSNAFGAELRSRRGVSVLSRAVSRDQYLAALWLSGLIPGLLYVVSLLGSGLTALAHTPLDVVSFLDMLLALLFLMVWISTLGLLLSLLLPGFLAWAAVGALGAIFLYLSDGSRFPGVGSLASGILRCPQIRGHANVSINILSGVSTLVQAALFALIAHYIFRNKDINSSAD